MGSDPAPYIANLFLYVYENRYMEKLKKSDLKRATNLRHVFRFIDDLIALNDDDEFLRSYKEIYPEEMELKVENKVVDSASILDLGLQVEDQIFKSNLYDKREAFKFSVVRMPYKSSNMPYKCTTPPSVPKSLEYAVLLLIILLFLKVFVNLY